MFKSTTSWSVRGWPIVGAVLLVWLFGLTACSSADDETRAATPSAEASRTPEGQGGAGEPATATGPAGTPALSPEPGATSPGAQVTPSSTPSGPLSLTGVFAAVIGDPFPNTDGQAKFAANLTDENGVTWRLFFDESTSRPSGPLLQLNGEVVVVEGTKMADQDYGVLVDSLRRR